MDSSSTTEYTKLTITFVASIIISVVAMIIIATGHIPPPFCYILIPVIAYFNAVIMSVIYQYSVCKKVTIIPILIGDLVTALTTSAAVGVLLLESIPFLKYIFGPYDPRNPVTGLQYPKDSDEYIDAMSKENHYKIQFFSGIVKAVLPVYLSEEVKNGFVYFYWVFWMTFLPQYFMMSVQAAC